MAKYVSLSKMDPKLKAKWVEALRSDKYKQGQEYLNAGNQYCCLGVLCKISRGPLFKDNKDGSFGKQEANTELTADMLRKVGLAESDMQELISRNDGTQRCGLLKAQSFKQIANFIEKNIKVKDAA